MPSATLLLRPLRNADWPQLRVLCGEPEVARWIGQRPHTSEGYWRERLLREDPEQRHCFVAIVGERMVALAGLRMGARPRNRHSAVLDLVVGGRPEDEPAGRITLRRLLDAADRWLAVDRIELDLESDDALRVGMLDDEGFEVEGRKQAARYREGELREELMMARLRPGWTPADTAQASQAAPTPKRPSADARPQVTIRALRKEDAGRMALLNQQESVLWGTLQVPTHGHDYWRSRLEGTLSRGAIALVAEVEDQLVGSADFFRYPWPREHCWGLGMSVLEAWQGHGIGNALVETGLELCEHWSRAERLELEVFPENSRARALYEKHGFVTEGVRRFAFFRDGAWADSMLMARLAGAEHD